MAYDSEAVTLCEIESHELGERVATHLYRSVTEMPWYLADLLGIDTSAMTE